MIEDVTGFVIELLELFPSAQEDQRVLCVTEVSAINKTRKLALLNDVACEDDEMLAAEVKKEMDSRGYNVNDWKAGGDPKIWLGDDNVFGVNSKGHNFARFTTADHTDVHLGI